MNWIRPTSRSEGDSKDGGAEAFFQGHVDDYRAEHYQAGYRTFMSVRQSVYLEEIDRLDLGGSPVRVVEAGCGPGFLAQALRDRGFQISAFDTSEEMLRLTHELLGPPADPPHELRIADIEHLPYEAETFDLYVSAGVIEYLKTDGLALSEAYRVLKPGGYIVISTTNLLSHAGCLDGLVEAAKRQPLALGLVNRVFSALGRRPIRPRPFKVRRHRPGSFAGHIREAGFTPIRDGFFYFLPWPHPFDRLLPSLSDRLGRGLDWLAGSRLRWLGEGYYVVARK